MRIPSTAERIKFLITPSSDNPESEQIQQHSFLKSVILHLLPGIFILICILIVTPLIVRYDLPEVLVLVFALGIGVLFELGYLLIQGKRKTGNLSLAGALYYRKPMSIWQYILFIVPIMVWIGFVFGVISPPIDDYLIENVFFWLPDSLLTDMDFGQYSRPALILMWFVALIFNGIGGPLVEELYFRGHLLPKISRYGRWAPVINSVLFSLYHFFSPWQNPARILALLPMVYAVYIKKNIYISIIVHCGINTLGLIAMLPEILGS